MPEFFQNLSENHWKSIQNWVLEGSGAVQGPFREARRPRYWFFIDFGGPFWDPFWSWNVEKSLKDRFKTAPRCKKNWTQSCMASNIEFLLILEWFGRYFFMIFGMLLGCRRNVNVHKVFKYFSTIFILRRYNKIFKIYCKNVRILNIRVCYSHHTLIKNIIEKSC